MKRYAVKFLDRHGNEGLTAPFETRQSAELFCVMAHRPAWVVDYDFKTLMECSDDKPRNNNGDLRINTD